MTFTPLGDTVLVKRDNAETATAAGILLTRKEMAQTGTVTVLGTDFGDPAIVTGTRIMFSKYSPIPVEIDGTTYELVDRSDILGIME